MTPEPAPAESELRRDPVSGRLVVIAPEQAKRPGAALRRLPDVVTPEELANYPPPARPPRARGRVRVRGKGVCACVPVDGEPEAALA